ncbi:MAG: DUF1501 domain-containing protein [Alphaproteobacteria bacterium]|nr:DUF1501 domain-containing protein [Alphaproteobacteria bacterium]MDE2074150.1 DUF1501 domain-containing protein [Alphaproteobacteria bacterium]MDE2352846.1 DUF1501 domain-containing protein [Alphaproteobacteria bacterium]
MTTRRSILKTMAAGAISIWGAPLTCAFANVPTDRRFVVVILRGALDGLAAVPPYGDPDYAGVRGQLALNKTGANPLHDLDGFFGLHPALTNMKSYYDAKQLTVFHNICSPYHDRSHFDGQNVLETGGTAPHVLDDGWLNRALKPMGLAGGEQAVAVEQTPPLMLTGSAKVTSWMPDVLPEPEAEFLAKVKALYAGDTALAASLKSALALQAEAQAAMDDPAEQKMMKSGTYGNLSPLFQGAGKLLALPDGPRVAVLDVSGWDTHFAEGAGDGQLARRLRALDTALDSLKTSLGPAWTKTAIVMATEFGRTVHVNGSSGTDHGTGGAAFLLGGAVAGGSVKADWVGLKTPALRDGRDQPARTDLRALFKGVLAEHMGVPQSALDEVVFPESGETRALSQLMV